jgi:hypothetical protein
MPIEDKTPAATKSIIDFEAYAALDAAMYWAGTDLTRYSLPVDSTPRQEGVRNLKSQAAKGDATQSSRV